MRISILHNLLEIMMMIKKSRWMRKKTILMMIFIFENKRDKLLNLSIMEYRIID